MDMLILVRESDSGWRWSEIFATDSTVLGKVIVPADDMLASRVKLECLSRTLSCAVLASQADLASEGPDAGIHTLQQQ